MKAADSRFSKRVESPPPGSTPILFASSWEARFSSAERYDLWLKAVEDHYLIHWSKRRFLKADNIREWLKRPNDLLKLLLLSTRYVTYYAGSAALPRECKEEYRSLCQQIADALPKREKRPPLIPENFYESRVMCKEPSPDGSNGPCWGNCPPPPAMRALTQLSAQIPLDELFESISIKTREAFDADSYHETLQPYVNCVFFVIAAEHDRLRTAGKDNKLWEIVDHYIHDEKTSWDIRKPMFELQQEINAEMVYKRISADFETEAKIVDCTGEPIRYLYLRYMIDNHLDRYSTLIEDWYQKVAEVCPEKSADEASFIPSTNERENILGELRNGNDKAKALAEKLAAKKETTASSVSTMPSNRTN